MNTKQVNLDSKRSNSVFGHGALRRSILALVIPLAACGADTHEPTAGQAAKGLPVLGQQAAQRRAKAGPIVPAGSGNLSLTSAEARRLYGPGIFRQDALSNTIPGIVNNREQVVSNRFRATINGHLSTARLYWQPGKGYSSGNGGTIRLRLMPDDGSAAHRPNLSASPLATAYFTPGQATYQGKPIFGDAHFSSQQPLVAGRLYHLVLDNVDGAPHRNYISSNNAISNAGNGRPSRWISTTDWATLLGKRAAWSGAAFSWEDLTQNASSGNYYIPILQLTTRDGQRQGSTIMESGSVAPKRIFPATSNSPVREQFLPRSNKRVTGLSFATAAAVGGSLRWRIMHGSQELASGRISSGANYRALSTNNTYQVGKVYWYDASFGAITLQAGQTYDVEFHPEGGSRWMFADFRNGSRHGFGWPASFTESHAQHRLNGRWINFNHFNHNSSGDPDSNWPVVLHLAP